MVQSNPKLKKAVIEALSNDNLASVNFDWNGLVVTYQRFLVIRDKVKSDAIKCTTASQFGKIRPGLAVAAQYLATSENDLNLPGNQFVFPDEDFGSKNVMYRSAYESAVCLIIHESTHAIFDNFMRGKSILSADNEAAACFAAGLFSVKSQFSMLTTGGGESEVGQRLAEKAQKYFKPGGKTQKIPVGWQGDLLDAVRFDNDLVNHPEIQQDRTNVEDIMDGV